MAIEMNFGVRCLALRHVEYILSELIKIMVTRLQDKLVTALEQVQFHVNVRTENHPMEPVKFGGMGICDLHTFTIELGLTKPEELLQVLLKKSVKMVSENCPVYEDLRGFGFKCNKLNYSKKLSTKGNTLSSWVTK